MLKDFLEIKESVQNALAEGKPVVALESTIISHGMPYPQNVETARNVERIIREQGAEPATIAIIGGKIKTGLNDDELEYLGRNGNVIKTSRRDIPFVIARGADGATTVAATMIIAALSGIRVFVTGGIGGVHRGAQQTFDISADLEELARTNVAVVCAGVKSILDLPLTLEYLETRGVPVVGYRTDELPAFYTRESGLNVDYRVDTPQELAAAVKTKWELGLDGGLVIANPIPEEFQMDGAVINQAIEAALADASKENVCGKDTTPYLLAKIKDITGGDSLRSNVQLIYSNAALGANLAVELAKKS
ncbi:pseudouridine-5'-phosphate glycosidase [Peptococcaceae bacterium CEB3]|nr:pseudouridine-5'-phosphate glycosidase [Peptococcaceae bacterium CEB3]